MGLLSGLAHAFVPIGGGHKSGGAVAGLVNGMPVTPNASQPRSLADLVKSQHQPMPTTAPVSPMVNQSAPLQAPMTTLPAPSAGPFAPSIAPAMSLASLGAMPAPSAQNQSGMVSMQAPDGSVNQVPAEHSSYYQSLGARML